MKISHIGMYVRDLERSRKFYETYFDGKSNCQYHNPQTNLKTYFLIFESGARLELMHRPEYTDSINEACASGLTHLAFSTGSRGGVDALTAKLAADGYIVAGQPRTTGDGYYESIVLDPDGYRIEITE